MSSEPLPNLSAERDRLLELARPLQPRKPPAGRVIQALGWANLLYLAALPLVATAVVVHRHGSPGLLGLNDNAPPVIAVAGFAAVAVELSVLVSYTRFPDSVLTALLVLLDGPVIALLTAASDRNGLDFAIRGFLIDGSAVWLAIGALSLTTRKLRGRARLIPSGLMVLFLVSIAVLFWPYLVHDLPHTREVLLPLIGGLLWATGVNYRVLATDEVVREGDSGGVMAYILVFSLGWIVCYGVAQAFHR